MNNRLKKCPVCNTDLEIVEYHCNSCDTTIRGQFQGGDFDALSQAQLEFAKVFLCAGGNIKEVEKSLSISYPTVKNKLQEVINILCHESTQDTKLSVLEQVEKGKISIDAAIKQLQK